jgi:hypothetical protein
LLSEWIGCGDFQDQFGGIEGRNKKFGAKWRKHLPKYIYSRTKERTIKGMIRAYAKQRKKVSDIDACREMQQVYEQKKRNVKKMVDYFTTTNLILKNARQEESLAVAPCLQIGIPEEPRHLTEL